MFDSPARVFGFFTITATVIGVLQAFKIWELLLSMLSVILGTTISFLAAPYYGIPQTYWILALVALLSLGFFLIRQGQYLKLVAGEFYDDFKHGLDRWNYGNDGWRTELDDDEQVLSVTESDIGGITQVGFWDRFSFSFENKLLAQGKGGWVVKAWDRSNYIMLQIVILDEDGSDAHVSLTKGVYIRPHYRYQGKWIVWPHYKLTIPDEILKNIRAYTWFGVEVKVRGNAIDLFLENRHVYHLVLDDPLVIESSEDIKVIDENKESKENLKTRRLELFSYPSGKVGFRCSGTGEHMHVRKVRVKPILS